MLACASLAQPSKKHWLIKLIEGLKEQTEKEKMKMIRPWKPNHCKNGWKRRTNQSELKSSSCPPVSPNWAAPVPPHVSFPCPRSVACSWREKQTEQHRTAETLSCTNLHGCPSRTTQRCQSRATPNACARGKGEKNKKMTEPYHGASRTSLAEEPTRKQHRSTRWKHLVYP